MINQPVLDNKIQSVRSVSFLAAPAACAAWTKAININVKLVCGSDEMIVLFLFVVRVRNGLDAEAAGFLSVNSDTLAILSHNNLLF